MAQTEALGLAKLLLQLAGVGPEALHQLLLPSAGSTSSSTRSSRSAGLQRRKGRHCRISAGYGL